GAILPKKFSASVLGFRAGHYVFEWLLTLWLEFGMRQRLTREHLVAHGRVVNKSCFHERGLSEILGLQALVGVHVRMMRARAVIERILDELKTGQNDAAERFVIRAARVAHR